MRAETGEILSPAEYEIAGEVKALDNRTANRDPQFVIAAESPNFRPRSVR